MRGAWPLSLGLFTLAITLAWAFGLDAPRWNWQAGLWMQEPWRLWTCALLSGNGLHLAGNAVGALLLALLGWQARLGVRALAAFALAWPLTHVLLALRPDLPAYFGASGLLHGAAVLVGLGLLQGDARDRRIGQLMLLVILIKLGIEQPWGATLRFEPIWGGMATVPWSHSMGALAGLLGALLSGGLRRACRL